VNANQGRWLPSLMPSSLVDTDRRFRGVTASIIRANSKPRAEKLGEVSGQAGQGGALAGPVGYDVGAE
jgi:hypothetical protein